MNNSLKTLLTLFLLIAVPVVISQFGQASEVVCGFLPRLLSCGLVSCGLERVCSINNGLTLLLI